MWNNISVLLENLFLIFGGMAVFMVGMQIMSQNLEKATGSKMRVLMSKISNNRLAGVGIGAAVTALMNSSGATTVMLVGFVNVGILSLAQATTIIMGANIGTTISAQIFAFTGESAGLSVTGVMALVSLVGVAVTMIGKKDLVRQIGYILIGIGFIFIGLKFLSGAVGNLTAEGSFWGEKINEMFIAVGGDTLTGGSNFALWQMLVLFLLGMFLTALIHSSAAMTAIVISLAGSGLISMPMAIFITLGSNIGTCFTTIVASFGTTTNAKRTAVIHLAFNVIGCIVFIIPLIFFYNPISGWILSFSNFGVADMSAESVIQHAIANFHLIFNLITTIVLLPFTKLLVRFAETVISEKADGKKSGSVLRFIDERFLEAPSIAVTQVRKEIVAMADLAFANYKRSLKMLTEGDFSEKKIFDDTETEINALNKQITSFCIRLSTKELSDTDEKKISAFFHNVSDLERIGDYAQNVTEYAARLAEEDGRFSDFALEEIAEADKYISELYGRMLHCFEYRDVSGMPALDAVEEKVDRVTDAMQQAHIERMSEGRCSPVTGAIYLQLSGNMERIADHMVNVAHSVASYARHDNKENKTV